MANRLVRPNTTERGTHRRRTFARAVALACAVAVAATTAMTGCADSDAAANEVIVTGSTTMLPIAEIAGEMFHDRYPDKKVLVSGLGSSAGIETVAGGSSDIGTSSRDLKPSEEQLGLHDTPIAYDAIAVIVHPGNPIEALTLDEVRAIFSGEIENWSELGGADKKIGLVNRDEASGTREAFHNIVMGDTPFDRTAAVLPGTGQVRSVVANAPGAIGYISLGFVSDEVKAVTIDGVTPTAEAVITGEYPIQRLLHFFTVGPPAGLAQDYIDFVLSSAVQDSIVKDAGFTSIIGGDR